MSNKDQGGFQGTDGMRNAALRQEFEKSIGCRVLFLTSQFPYLFIGEIREVITDFIAIDVETTHIEQLENRVWTLHLDTINAFYIERAGQPSIPNLNN